MWISEFKECMMKIGVLLLSILHCCEKWLIGFWLISSTRVIIAGSSSDILEGRSLQWWWRVGSLAGHMDNPDAS